MLVLKFTGTDESAISAGARGNILLITLTINTLSVDSLGREGNKILLRNITKHSLKFQNYINVFFNLLGFFQVTCEVIKSDFTLARFTVK